MSIGDMIKKLSDEKAVVESLKNLANKRALTSNEAAKRRRRLVKPRGDQ